MWWWWGGRINSNNVRALKYVPHDWHVSAEVSKNSLFSQTDATSTSSCAADGETYQDVTTITKTPSAEDDTGLVHLGDIVVAMHKYRFATTGLGFSVGDSLHKQTPGWERNQQGRLESGTEKQSPKLETETREEQHNEKKWFCIRRENTQRPENKRQLL